MSADSDITFHYPPELFNLLVDTIPLLSRSKKDVLLFFRGAGVSAEVTGDLAERLNTAPNDINKYALTRTVLDRLNARGETTLRERREVVRRVVDFTSFDSCWPNDQLKAKGLVAAIRDVVNQKDAFTRMNHAREQERQARLLQAEEIARAARERATRLDVTKNEFYALFAPGLERPARGKLLETALNNLFKAYGILAHESFHLVGLGGEGIVEQIDGVIDLGGVLHYVEIKWYETPLGVAEVSQHLVRLMSRAEARGLFISGSSYTEPAIQTCRDFLQHKTIALSTLREVVRVLEQKTDLADFLVKKIRAAQIHKNPFFSPIDGE